MSAAVVVSMVVSLTLTPMMCSRLLRPEHEKRHGHLWHWSETVFPGMFGLYERGLQMGARPPATDLDRRRGHAGRHDLALCHHPQGPAAVAGHGHDHRRHRRLAIHFLPGDGRNASARWPKWWRRTPTWPAWPPLSAPARSIPPPIPAGFTSALSPATSATPRSPRSLTACATPPLRCREFPFTCRPCRMCRLTAVSAAPSTNTPCTTPTKQELAQWAPQPGRGLVGQAGAGRRRQRPTIQRLWPECGEWTGDKASQLNVLPQAIDDTLYDAFGQRQVSIIFTQLNQYRVVLEAEPKFPA